MRRFTQLFIELDRTKRTSEKVEAMERYFRDPQVLPEDAAWALFFLAGRKLKRLITWRIMDDAIRTVTGLPDWLIGESYESVGDAAEMMALLFPLRELRPTALPLHRVVNERMVALRTVADPARQRDLIIESWNQMDSNQRLVFNKLLTGNFRVGVAQTLIIRALAAVANVTPAIMAHRFAGAWEPTVESYLQLLHGGGEAEDRGQAAQPYPYFLAYPLEQPPHELGPIDDWQIEWKYDGLRGQIIRRRAPNSILIWSRGDELITPAFPEIAHAAAELPDNTVLDGEIVAWENDHPLPFALLQRRINRKAVESTLWGWGASADVPVVFMAFDLLEANGDDLRERPLEERRRRLEETTAQLPKRSSIRVAPVIEAPGWEELARLRAASRENFTEGLMLKRRNSVYRVGRKRGDWWKWKIDPYTVDAVLIYAQGGSGRRSGLFTDYTFGVWDGTESGQGDLVPVAKAYSGLTDEEIRQVDRFIRTHTIEKRGPVRIVEPQLVFELAFEAIQESTRHKAGLAIRFPRMNRWRTDKKPHEADTLETLRALLRATRGES